MIFRDAIGFMCDERSCSVKHTVMISSGETEAYLDLIDAGWTVKRSIAGPWKHLCPDHAGEVEKKP